MFSSCNLYRITLLVGGILFLAGSGQASLRLDQVLQVYPEVGQFDSSRETSFHLGDGPQILTIGEHSYSIRFFMFQAPESMAAMQNVPFGQWIQAQGLLTTKSRKESREFGTFIYFKSPEELESKGVFYVLSLGPIDGAPLEIAFEDVLKHAPIISDFIPSKFVLGSKDGLVRKIAGQEYELRYFVFWVDPSKASNDSLTTSSFKKICSNCDILQTESRDIDRGYGPLKIFSQTDSMKERGVYFTLVLRSIA